MENQRYSPRVSIPRMRISKTVDMRMRGILTRGRESPAAENLGFLRRSLNGGRRRKFAVGNAYLWIRESKVWTGMDKGQFDTYLDFCHLRFLLFTAVALSMSPNLCNHVYKKLLNSGWRRYVGVFSSQDGTCFLFIQDK